MKRIATLLLVVFQCVSAEYDCIFVGTSPLFLFEALYQQALGKRVLILEEAACCGGAWQSVDVCGVAHADVGCHEIGNSSSLKNFLEEYGGCSLRSVDESNGFYFEGGCYALVHNLVCRIEHSSIQLLLNHRVERAFFDEGLQVAVVEAGGVSFTCDKLYAPSYAYFPMDDEPAKRLQKHQFPHLYIRIHDLEPARFAYKGGTVSQASRMMNLTHFVDLQGTREQLIVFQTWNMDYTAEHYLEELKNHDLVSRDAYLLDSEWFTYEQYPSNSIQNKNLPWFEQLQTFDFRGIIHHIARWTEAISPFAEAISSKMSG